MAGREGPGGKTVDVEREIQEKLKSLNISPAQPVVCPVQDPGKFGQPCKIVTNAFGLSPTGELVVFQYTVSVIAQFGSKTVEFTKKSNRDSIVNDRKQKTIQIFKHFLRKEPDFWGNPDHLWYDGQSTLYSDKNFFSASGAVKQFAVDGVEISEDLKGLPIKLEVFPSKNKSFTFSCDRLCHTASSNLVYAEEGAELNRFMEIVLNQEAILHPEKYKVYEAGKTFLVDPQRHGFEVKELPDGKYLGVGMQKSVRLVEGPGGRTACSTVVVADSKKAAFHKEQFVHQKVEDMTNGRFNHEKIGGVLKGLYVRTTHLARQKEIQIAALARSAQDTRLEYRDRQMTVQEYYKEKHGIELSRPDLPLLMVRERGQHNLYPMELCKVAPMQRVTIPQQTPQQSQQTTRACAVAPAQRQVEIWNVAAAQRLVPPGPNQPLNNPHITNAGFTVLPSPCVVDGRILNGPLIRYLNGAPGKFNEAISEKGAWRFQDGMAYLCPARCDVWAIYGMVDNRVTEREAEDNIRTFAKRFVLSSKSKGMTVSNPADLAVLKTVEELEKRMVGAKSANCGFIMLVTSEKITTVHGKLKLLERKFQIPTQDVKYETLLNVVQKNQRQTMDNILHKTNMKLGGLNYSLNLAPLQGSDWIRPERLFIGMAISHPPPGARFDAEKVGASSGSSASVLGYACNVLGDPHAIVGDFIFQDMMKEETMPSLSKVLSHVMELYKKNHEGRTPTELWMYRSGVGEGSYKNIIKYEVPMLRDALKKLNLGSTKLVFIVANKEHNVRLFKTEVNRSDKATAQNIQSGVVVDSELTHPNLKEFYLNSHTTLQGSARTPRYTVLTDDVNVPMDELEGVTYALTFGHQIVTLATSLPSPLYIANRYAERGRKVIQAFLETMGELPSLEAYTDKLSYSGSVFENRRINA